MRAGWIGSAAGAAALGVAVSLGTANAGQSLSAGCPPSAIFPASGPCFTYGSNATYRTLTTGNRWKVYVISDGVCVGESWSEGKSIRLELWAFTARVESTGRYLTTWYVKLGGERADLTPDGVAEMAHSGQAQIGDVDYDISEPREFIAAWSYCAARVQDHYQADPQ